ncbi:hypothetical protein RIF29_18225 [Crotalaria pallida]|uniref:Glycosyltransferase N-terminal domain-containing protein n=1 Tax=Crotalaria pallida TaxID=3830 RepID=A0AAN9IH68_CROPI
MGTQKPHVVCVPFPAQGHVNPFMQLAKLLHCKGFHITFVNNEYNHKRLIKSQGAEFVKGQPDFKFETIPDGMPPSVEDETQDVPSLCIANKKHSYEPLKELVNKLNNSSPGVPPVSCIIYDGIMCFASKVAKDLGIPELVFWTASACGLMGYLQYHQLAKRHIFPFKDENFVTDGTLDTSLDWIIGMKDMRLKDLPSFIRDTSKVDSMFDFWDLEAQHCLRTPLIINTFEEFDSQAIEFLSSKNPNIYNIGSLHLLGRHFPDKEKGFNSSGSSLWKNDSKCIKWLDQWEPSSVIYVNYGSIAKMTEQHLKEFAWGLADSNLPFFVDKET